MAASRKTEIKRFMRGFGRPPVDLVLLLQDVEDPVDVGSAFRIADALKATQLVLTGISAKPPHKLISKVGRGKHRRVSWKYHEDVSEALTSLRHAGYFICAVEIESTATPYYALEFPPKTCLVVGHEDHGVTKRALGFCDRSVFIPMYGKGASLNVHVALGVIAFHVLHQGLSGPGQQSMG